MLRVCTSCNTRSYKSYSATSSVICNAQIVYSSNRAAMYVCHRATVLPEKEFALILVGSIPLTSSGTIFSCNFTLELKRSAALLVHPMQKSTEDSKLPLISVTHTFSPKTRIILQINKLNNYNRNTKAFSKCSILEVLKYLLLKLDWSSQGTFLKKFKKIIICITIAPGNLVTNRTLLYKH